jgi:CheY-like chemotaxis protein
METRKALQTILVVEDQADSREILVQVLAMRYPGVAFLEASDARIALECIRSHAPQIVITDISLPGKDGIALSREIRALCAEVKFIIISAHETDHMLGRFAEDGTDIYGYLTKPVEFPALFATLDRCIAELPFN